MHRFFACQHIDVNTRMMSASGAFFPAVADYIFSKGGIVYGATFSVDFRSVIHERVVNSVELRRLQGSKYIQSDSKGIYKDVCQQLSDGRLILFSGTPCQIAGLKSYLKCDYNNLICIDLVCHGVADKNIYLYYLNYLERKYSSKLTYVNFRDKKKSWRHADVVFRFQNGNSLIEQGMYNSFMRGFISNLFIREACTHCRFKNFSSGSDMTIGDFWGSAEDSDYAKDDTGISVVAVHTNKGQILFDNVQTKLTNVKELNENDAYLFNESYKKCAVSHCRKEEFYFRYKTEDFNNLIEELLFEKKKKESFLSRSISYIKAYICRYAFS